MRPSPNNPPRDPNHAVRLMLAMVPDDVRASISKAELEDRLVESARLTAQASDPDLSADLRKAARIRAQAILRAQPRAVTEAKHRELVAKAEAMPPGFRAQMVREHARQVLEDHPIAPDRAARARRTAPRPGGPVRKAAEGDGPMPVFDQDGNLVGIVEDPDDITLISNRPKASPEQAAQAAEAGQEVAKQMGGVFVFDRHFRPGVVHPRRIRQSAGRVAKAAGGGLVTVRDEEGREYQVDRASLRTPEEQARDTGPVSAGGTTGMGQPRKTGPAASYPADGPQRAKPGDVPGRQVIKGLGSEWTEVYDWLGAMVGAVKQGDIVREALPASVAKSAENTHANVYDSRRRKIGIASLDDIVPLATLQRAGSGRPVAKSAAPGRQAKPAFPPRWLLER
jgi:hypothetical protein